MHRLKNYASFIKLEHTLFSIPLVFSGALLADRAWPSFRVAGLILLAAAAARVVAMALNRIIDRKIDKKNPRTLNRHLASGLMKLFEAWIIVAVSLAFYLWAARELSDFCLRWSWIPILGFTAYPFFKRLTKWTHVGLGLVWSLVPLGGFFAVRSSLDGAGPIVALGVFCVFWLAGFDIIYATMDEEFDRAAGLHSLPAEVGAPKALRMASWFHALAFFSLVILYLAWLGGPLTVLMLAAVGVLLYVEQKYSGYVDLAFFQINTVIGFVVLLFVWAGIKGV